MIRGTAPSSEPSPKKRGRAKGEPRPPSRPPEVIYKAKLEAAFKGATNLVRKLKGLQRDRYVRGSESARTQYVAFLASLMNRVHECHPQTGEQAETLADWTG